MTLSATYLILLWVQSAFHHQWQKAVEYFPGSGHCPFLFADIWWSLRYFREFLNNLIFNYSIQEMLFMMIPEPYMLQTNFIFSRFSSETTLSFMGFMPSLPSFALLMPVMWCCHPHPYPAPSLYTVLLHKVPKTLKYCADVIESSFVDAKQAISKTRVIPVFK